MSITTSTLAPSAVEGLSPSVTAAPRQALTTRFVDFWLLGGASLLAWLVMFGTQGFRAAWAIDQHFKNLTVTTASLSLLINYPHFLISYKLAYSRGRAFVTAHWWQLLVVPAALIATFAFAYAYYSTPVSQLPIFSMLSSDLRGLGTNAQAFSAPRLAIRSPRPGRPRRAASAICGRRFPVCPSIANTPLPPIPPWRISSLFGR